MPKRKKLSKNKQMPVLGSRVYSMSLTKIPSREHYARLRKDGAYVYPVVCHIGKGTTQRTMQYYVVRKKALKKVEHEYKFVTDDYDKWLMHVLDVFNMYENATLPKKCKDDVLRAIQKA